MLADKKTIEEGKERRDERITKEERGNVRRSEGKEKSQTGTTRDGRRRMK